MFKVNGLIERSTGLLSMQNCASLTYPDSCSNDSFTLKCAYEPAMAEVLRRAVRFTAREDGTVEFAGVAK